MKIWYSFLVVLLLLVTCSLGLATEFPGRSRPEYMNLKIIDLDTLHMGLNNGVFSAVDVRSKLEFDTIHIKGALHTSVARNSFVDDLRKVVNKAPGKKIAFY